MVVSTRLEPAGRPAPEGLRPVRRVGQRQRWRRVDQRRCRRRRRGPGHHRARQLGREHRDERGEPRLRGPAVRRAARRPAVPGRQQRLRRHRQRRPGPAGRRPDADHDVRPGAGRQRRADRAGGRRPRRSVHAGPGLRAVRADGDRSRRCVRPGTVRADRPPLRADLAEVRPATAAAAVAVRPGCRSAETDRLRSAYWLSANVLKASEDKTFPGAVVASLASPWGQAVSAGDTPGGNPVYFGSYREVFARDLYESFTGLMASGDLATARATVRFLFERQQLADGRFPRNSLVNGKLAPDTGGDQLDETAYPILMAYQAGLQGDHALWTDHVRKAADFVVSHGPSFGSERWEEQGGYSPSTIAAEIAGLVAAGRIADVNGATRRRACTAPPPTTSSAASRAGRSPPPVPTGRAATSSACRRTATPTRRSPTGSATAVRPPTSAPSSTPASSSSPGSGSCPRPTPTYAARCRSWTRPSGATPRAGPASTGTARPPTRPRRPAPRTGTATATSRTPPSAHPPGSRGRPAATAPATCGRC